MGWRLEAGNLSERLKNGIGKEGMKRGKREGI
jgi:hypothetical protein